MRYSPAGFQEGAGEFGKGLSMESTGAIFIVEG
jgi:hypothetical protein